MSTNAENRIKGVLAPVVTPFNADLTINEQAFVEQCKWLIENDVGLAVFGTNSEASSLSMPERKKLLQLLIEAGIPKQRLMPGTGCCSIPETVALTKHALALGVNAVLMLPPFYYKSVSDDGIVQYFSKVIDDVGSDELRVYLYHFPATSQVPISLRVVEKLLAKYPRVVAGIKDSSGDWEGTRSYISNFSAQGFDVFPGTEMLLRRAILEGGAGCISATANVNPNALAALYLECVAGGGETADEDARRVRSVFQAYPLIAAMKRVIAGARANPNWSIVRPPLVSLSNSDYDRLGAQLLEAGFEGNELCALPGVTA
ncbi:dihydrodipicolinate synthetase [Burkholderiaceae bacterium 16]|nr:dihydrodipicolinate synthetase [Burkholderiaceae bacterium 16]